jgi:hypothetical protein
VDFNVTIVNLLIDLVVFWLWLAYSKVATSGLASPEGGRDGARARGNKGEGEGGELGA